MDPSRDHPEDADAPGGEIVWLFDADAAPDDAPPCTPAELFVRLDRAAAREGLGQVSVRGAVRGVRRRGRICTFELADYPEVGESPVALIRVVLFPDQLRAVEADLAAQRRRLADGMDATVTGAVRFDAPFGGVRIAATAIEAHEDQAEIAARAAALVAELERTGMLTRQAALVVPGRPLHVGLITAAGTAGDTDITALLEASGIEWQLSRRSVPMAGPNAPAAVAGAIASLARAKPDVIVVARGGGGRSELGCWDSDVVARAIASAPVPVWTAIGHASDATVADRVANRSCVTPSAAAAALIERVRDFERHRHERAVFAAHRDRVAAERAKARRARLLAAVAVLALVLVLLVVVG